MASEAATAAVPWGTPPPEPTLTDEERARLEAGEILVRDARVDEAGGAGFAVAIYHVDAPSLWTLLGDCAANQRFVRGLQECEVSGETATRATTRQRLKPYAMLPALDYRFETLREPHRWIRIRLIDGDLRALSGSWRFDPLEDGRLLVSHAIRVQPRYPVPRWLARRTVKKDLAALMACLRWEARAWPDARQRGVDRQACPDGP
ncbi:MAG: SRPBCC family protein [Xanthomonadales bacterium]|nr:SRPBCC family protein [Xanthomonadales bacterium]